MFDSVTLRDLFMGAAKGMAFGLLMAWICLAKGFFLHLDPVGAHGSEGVSRVTTDAVVLSSIAVLFSDYIISALIL
jgi:phospholipid/cholesterol/gamma-HCH transport system permease protein